MTFFAFDTVVDITVYGENRDQNERILAQAQELCEWYEGKLSATVEGSDIALANSFGGGKIEVDPHTAAVIDIGLDYSDLSYGVFDITIGSVSRLWDFAAGSARLPDEKAIRSALEQVGYRRVGVDGTVLEIKSGVQIDLGGIAKGYIADRLGEYFVENGIESALINLGGNVLAVGGKDDDSPWTVGVEKPFSQTGELIGRVAVKDGSVVTSGVSQRSFWLGGTLYHHLLDTSTGYPVNNGLYSVTVLSEESVDAEALSTICFLLGLEEGLALLDKTPGVHGIFVMSDYTVYTTEGLEDDYEIQWE